MMSSTSIRARQKRNGNCEVSAMVEHDFGCGSEKRTRQDWPSERPTRCRPWRCSGLLGQLLPGSGGGCVRASDNILRGLQLQTGSSFPSPGYLARCCKTHEPTCPDVASPAQLESRMPLSLPDKARNYVCKQGQCCWKLGKESRCQ